MIRLLSCLFILFVSVSLYATEAKKEEPAKKETAETVAPEKAEKAEKEATAKTEKAAPEKSETVTSKPAEK